MLPQARRIRSSSLPAIASLPRYRSFFLSVGFLAGLYAGVSLSSIQPSVLAGCSGNNLPSSSQITFHPGHSAAAAVVATIVDDKKDDERNDARNLHMRVDDISIKYQTSLEMIKRLQSQLHECQQQQKQKCKNDDTFGSTTPKIGTGSVYKHNTHPMCQSFGDHIPSTGALWSKYISNILKASRLPNDSRFDFEDFTAELLHLVSNRLHRSIKSLPYEWDSLEHVLTIAYERFKYLQLSDLDRSQRQEPPPRPVKILIMGGSLLVGTNCRKLIKEFRLQFLLPNRECTWSNRLEKFLNTFFDANGDAGPLVEVTKTAMGGTNTATGQVILEYDLVPEEAQNPDIIINAYSTNDMHILTIMEAQSANITLRDKVFEMTQAFVRQVMQRRPKSCGPDQPPPLLMHMDDYLGNEQNKIWDTTELTQGIQVLASYYGFVSMSFSDVVRDVVYGDTEETWFSSDWWGGPTHIFERNIHPGMGMHISSTWITAYNLLNLITTYCSMPVPTLQNINNYNDTERIAMGLPPLKRSLPQAQGKPRRRPTVLPPELTKDLLLEEVTSKWKLAEASAPCDAQSGPVSSTRVIKCPFSWVSGLSLQQNNKTWVEEYFRAHASTWNGWVLSDDGGKLGFVPTGGLQNSKIVLHFKAMQPLRFVAIFFMKSYGERWERSRVAVQLSRKDGDDRLAERNIVGVHNKQTSEMYTEVLTLSDSIAPGEILEAELTFVDGITAKIMGVAVCS